MGLTVELAGPGCRRRQCPVNARAGRGDAYLHHGQRLRNQIGLETDEDLSASKPRANYERLVAVRTSTIRRTCSVITRTLSRPCIGQRWVQRPKYATISFWWHLLDSIPSHSELARRVAVIATRSGQH